MQHLSQSQAARAENMRKAQAILARIKQAEEERLEQERARQEAEAQKRAAFYRKCIASQVERSRSRSIVAEAFRTAVA